MTILLGLSMSASRHCMRWHDKAEAKLESGVFLPQITPAQLVRLREPFDSDEFLFELKMDGHSPIW
jgi:hypothetical protein